MRNNLSYLSVHPVRRCRSRTLAAIPAHSKRVVLAVYRAGCERYDISGIRFYLPLRDRKELKRVKANAEQAVRMLERFDPVRLERIRRDLQNGIVVAPGPNDALYHRDIGVCVLSWSLLLRENYVSAVLSIVHEAAHARMRYLPTPTPERAAHMERICIGAEIAFVSRLPGNGPILEALRRMQERMTPTCFAKTTASDTIRGRVERETLESSPPTNCTS